MIESFFVTLFRVWKKRGTTSSNHSSRDSPAIAVQHFFPNRYDNGSGRMEVNSFRDHREELNRVCVTCYAHVMYV